MGACTISLLERLAQSVNCSFLSELKYLTPARRRRLAGVVLRFPPEAATLADWNDALAYLTGAPAAPTAAEARAQLAAALR